MPLQLLTLIWLDKNDSGAKISIKEKPIQTPEEKLISVIGEKSIPEDQIENKLALKFLLQRPDYIIQSTEKSKTVSLTEKALHIDSTESDLPGWQELPGQPINFDY